MTFSREELIILARSNPEALVEIILALHETATNRLLPTDRPSPKQRACASLPGKSRADKKDILAIR
jgi:hypothetical protein